MLKRAKVDWGQHEVCGQIHGEFKFKKLVLIKDQIRHKLILFEGEAKCSGSLVSLEIVTPL